MTEFVFPKVKPGQYVLYSADGSQTERILALVIKVKSKAVDLRLLMPEVEALIPKEDCWHISDPRVQSSAETFIRQPNRGVFELIGEDVCDTEPRLAHLEQIVRGQQVAQARVTALAQRVDQLEGQLRELTAKRPPGRPRKPRETIEV